MTPRCPENTRYDAESAQPRLRTLRPSPDRATATGCPRRGYTRQPETAPAVRYRRHPQHRVPAARVSGTGQPGPASMGVVVTESNLLRILRLFRFVHKAPLRGDQPQG